MARENTEGRRNLTLLYRIENISYWKTEIHGRQIESNVFQPLCLDGRSIWFSVFPNCKDQDDPHIQVQLNLCEVGTNCSIDCDWSLLDDTGSPLITSTLRNQVLDNLKSIHMPGCPTHDEVFLTRKSSFLPHDTLTVRCCIWMSEGDLEQAEHFSACTRMKAEEVSSVWNIKAFRNLQLGQKVITPVEIGGFISFPLYFSLTGTSLEDARLKFQITAGQTKGVHLTLNISISKEEKVMKIFEGNYIFRDDIRKQIWGLPIIVPRKEILGENAFDWLSGEDLNLLCKFTAIQEDIYDIFEYSYCGPTNLKTDIPSVTRKDSTTSKHTKQNQRNDVSPFIVTSRQTAEQSGDGYHLDISRCKSKSVAILQEDFLTLYEDKTQFDFELRSGDASFPVHKLVLSARSPVFRTMFLRETEATSQDVPDVDPHTLDRMLTFLYAGTLDDMQWEDAAKLYYAADKYQVLSLKQECSYLLQSSVYVSNVCRILELADKHQDQELTSFVHDFILIHYDEIVLSDEWENFLERNSYFAGKTMKEIYKKKLQG